ncbi:Peptidoglycan/LPS O-acetylase OafA/YrhL, contains acyltransferase and SGNH-hydrolase domains [Sphingomonas gellani]|uniref:Peptidoglycan/LPS O-acetylase OafA/YrhL, contains acyltransferase and SGNH-hydrolase domains n=1 Tax=Sphingomonas gellani TaxID=1166340 RepID=A0A1H8JYJ9_9SPHN|nr:acyltransferase [Sphingomonas gellani]SEN85819.1 Peptidoglycan/LPS O-acetylase OafA/YrhL, contains acyltransferase and SGNH-hydrolase domains [Sphingomonas gellani]
MNAGPRRCDGKDHFEALDGLRGTAALLVVAFHIQGITVLFDAPRLLLPHAYLAVDFFFALSGFVVGYAYDDRWGTMSTAGFLRRRLIRLHPLVVLGAILGLLSYVADPFAGDRQAAPAILVMCAFVMAALALPSTPLPNRLGDSHPLNAPAWTLLQEYIGNLAYALVLRRLGTRALAVAVGVAGLLSAAMALTLGSYDTGWGLTNFWGAPVRLAYPFMTGLLLFRLQDRLPRWRIGFVPLSVALGLAFAAPLLPTVGGVKLNGLYQALCVLVLFPAIIVVGRHSSGGPLVRRLCRTAGALSYPLYMTHYPFVYVYMNWIAIGGATAWSTMWVAAALIVFTVVFAFLAYRLWDLPLRRALQRRDGKRTGDI